MKCTVVYAVFGIGFSLKDDLIFREYHIFSALALQYIVISEMWLFPQLLEPLAIGNTVWDIVGGALQTAHDVTSHDWQHSFPYLLSIYRDCVLYPTSSLEQSSRLFLKTKNRKAINSYKKKKK